MLASISIHSTVLHIFLANVFAGAGSGAIALVVYITAQASVTPADIPSVIALYTTCNSVGAFLGDLVSSSLYSRIIMSKLMEYLPADAKSNAQLIKNSIVIAKTYLPGTLERNAIDRAYTEAMKTLQLGSVLFFVMAGIVCLWVGELILDERMGRETDDDDDNHDRETCPLLNN